MAENKSPFTEHAAKARQGAKQAWVAAGVSFVVMVVAVCLWGSAHSQLQEMPALQAKLDSVNSKLNDALDQNQKASNQIATLQTQVADLQKDKDVSSQMARGLEDELRRDLESKDVTISNLQGRLTVTILDRVLFDSGEAVLQPAGEPVLRKIAGLLQAHPELKIHVVGHTDNIPIHTARFPSNWELSTARALAAVHFFIEKTGVDPQRIGAVGYGEFRPIADNSTPEGRAKNRRIAITLLSDELAASDAVPNSRTNLTLDPPVSPGTNQP